MNPWLLLISWLKSRIEQPEEAITFVADIEKAAYIAKNRNILKSIIQAALFCEQQCMPYVVMQRS